MSIENGCDYYYSCGSCAKEDCLVNKQKTEIERLTIELAEERIKGTNSFVSVLELKQENTKLQKQVDELTQQLLVAKLQGLTEGYIDGVQAERNAQIIKPTVVELPKEITQKIKQQAVKDTAKEILIPLIDCEKQIDPLQTGIRWSVLKGFCKKFGVEVE